MEPKTKAPKTLVIECFINSINGEVGLKRIKSRESLAHNRISAFTALTARLSRRSVFDSCGGCESVTVVTVAFDDFG